VEARSAGTNFNDLYDALLNSTAIKAN